MKPFLLGTVDLHSKKLSSLQLLLYIISSETWEFQLQAKTVL